MKKCAFSAAFLALSAFLAFLAACGEGEPLNLEGSVEWLDMQRAITEFKDEISRCAQNGGDNCPDLALPALPSSSSVEDDGLGDYENPDSSSDDSENQYSSPYEEDSSSSEEPPENKQEDCPKDMKDEILGKFTCYWDPSSVISGRNVTLKMNITDNNCRAGNAEKKIYAPSSVSKFGIATFNVDETIPSSGTYPHVSWDTYNPITSAGNQALAAQWQASGVFDKVYGLLICGDRACSKECEPLQILEAGKPVVDNLSLECLWQELTPGNLAINTVLGACTASGTVTNSDELEGCEGPYVEYCGGETPASCDVSKAGNLEVNAAVKCKLGGVNRLKTLKYKVVPNPTLSGTCVWSDNNKSPVSSAKGSKPSGVTLNDSYGRCSGVTDGALPTTAYGGNGVDLWPIDGIVPANTYDAVKTNLSCIPFEQQKSCPTLVVNAGAEHHITAKRTDAQGAVFAMLTNGECLDMDYTWDDAGWTGQRVDVRCDADPQFSWSETVNKGRKGCVKVTYNGASNVACDDYGVNAKIPVINSTTANGVYEILGVCVEMYYGTTSAKTDDVESSQKAKCRAAINGN